VLMETIQASPALARSLPRGQASLCPYPVASNHTFSPRGLFSWVPGAGVWNASGRHGWVQTPALLLTCLVLEQVTCIVSSVVRWSYPNLTVVFGAFTEAV
jgi:hypothetical protein